MKIATTNITARADLFLHAARIALQGEISSIFAFGE
jgi:hypothetical protein